MIVRLLWAVIATLLAWAPISAAQDSDSETTTTVLLDLGFSGALPSNEWAPVRVVVSPMERPIQAVARIAISMPDGAALTSMVPVATTPGRETVVPAVVWIPPSMLGIQLDLIAPGGGVIAASTYGAIAGAQSIALPPPSMMPMIVGVGSPTLRMAFGVDTYTRTFAGADGQALRDRVSIARVATATPSMAGGAPWLPTEPVAYGGVSAIVIDGQWIDRLEPATNEAIREWLLSGGRLLVVNASNASLRRLLGEAMPSGLSIAPPRETTLPAAFGGPASVVARTLDMREWTAAWEPLHGRPDLGIQGPAGLGWLMIASFDPDELAQAQRVEAMEVAWHQTLGVLIEHELNAGKQLLESSRWDMQSLDRLASSAGAAWVSQAPTVGVRAFVMIFAMLVALAFLLGPIDRLVLRRTGMLHRWWLTALGWILLATVGAWLLPTKVRSGPTTVSSIRVVDGWQDPSGRTRAWQETVDGMFLNRAARIELDGLEETAWLSPAVDVWSGRGAGNLVMAPQQGTMKPLPTTGRLWTTRTFRQQGPTKPPITADVEVRGETYAVRLQGDGAHRVDRLAVHTPDGWLHLLPDGEPEREGEAVVIRASKADLVDQPMRGFDTNRMLERDDFFRYWYETVKPEPALMAHLGEAHRRGRAFDALAKARPWAVVYAAWEDSEPRLATSVGEQFSTMWVYRLATPVRTLPGGSGGLP